MSSLNKFSMGGVPRTNTGLVPTSYRRQMDNMCSSTHFVPLPPKPKPAMYPYRGDFINERNRKMLKTRKRTKELRDKSCVGQIRDNAANSMNSEGRTMEWDPYCQHISLTMLSVEEQQTKESSKQNILTYLRSEASKRRQITAMENKLQSEIQLDEQETTKQVIPMAKKRKPPVPRLSRISRIGTISKFPRNELVCRVEKESRPLTSENVLEKAPKERRYLDFICKAKDKPKSLSPTIEHKSSHSTEKPQRMNSCSCSISMNGGKVREHVIVIEKASDIEMMEHNKATQIASSDKKGIFKDQNFLTINETLTPSSSSSSKFRSFPTPEQNSKISNNALCEVIEGITRPKQHELLERFHYDYNGAFEIALRENENTDEKSQSSCFPFISEEEEDTHASSSNLISEVSFSTPSLDGANQRNIFSQTAHAYSFSLDTSNEIFPRRQISPTCITQNNHVSTLQRCDPVNNLLYFMDTLSLNTSHRSMMTNESSFGQVSQYDPSDPISGPIPDNPSSDSDEAPEETLPPLLHAATLPSWHVEREEELQPRGYKLYSHDVNDDPVDNTVKETLEDDMLSLLG